MVLFMNLFSLSTCSLPNFLFLTSAKSCSALNLQRSKRIDIFWRRVIFKSDNNHWYLFCLVAIENLQYEVAVQSVNMLRRYLQLEVKSPYKLVIICSEEREEQSYMAAALENYKRPSHIANV